jgi:hypothetical protein
MEPSQPTLIAYDRKITREELRLVPTPLGTATHQPIPHWEVASAIVETLGFRHIAVLKDEYAVSRDGMRMFGVLELETTFNGCRFALGLRNSHNKSLALAITVGYRVLVCENLAFHGDFTPMCRKHTRNFNLIEGVSYAIDQTQRNFEPMVKAVELWKNTQITDVDAKLCIYEAFVEAGTALPKHLLSPVHDYYFKPPHEEFLPRTLWSLQNSFTGAIKTLDPIPAHLATTSVARFFDQRTRKEIE